MSELEINAVTQSKERQLSSETSINALKQGTNPRVILIKRKLALGFGALILLISINIIISMHEMGKIEMRAHSVIELRQPVVVSFLRYSEKLNLATTYLNAYLLTGHIEHKENYYELETELQNKLKDLQVLTQSANINMDNERILEFEKSMQKFYKYASRVIYLRDNEMENYPGLALADEFLLPNASAYLDLNTHLVRVMEEEPFSEQQQRILSLLLDVRYSWQQMMNALRLYFNTRNEANLVNLDLYDGLNLQRLKELKSMNVDIGYNGLKELEAYRLAWHQKLPMVIDIYKGDAWRADAYIMNTEVRPVVEQLRTILHEFSSIQVSGSRNDGQLLTRSLEQIHLYSGLILFTTLTLGIYLAIMLSRSIIPPMQRLMHAANRVAAGDLGIEMTVAHLDEVGKLTNCFNFMVKELREAETAKQGYLREVENLNRELEKKVENKVRELKSTQTQLLQSEKLASIGQLAAGVAHEINNPVGYINSNVSSLEQYLKDLLRLLEGYEQLEGKVQDQTALNELRVIKEDVDLAYLKQDIADLINESQEGVTRVKQIVQDLKDFSHVDEAEWQWADLHKGLDSTLNVARNETKYKAEVIKEYGEIPLVECMPSQLNQVFMNLIVNATHAIEDRGVITLRTGREGESVWVTIADTGKGMSDEVQKHMFEPFYTTKPVGSGTGLGLSLSYGIIEKHGGYIKVHSEEGRGTSFTVVLPIEQPKNEEHKVNTAA